MKKLFNGVLELLTRPRRFFGKIGPEHAMPSYVLLAVAGVLKGLREYFAMAAEGAVPRFHPLLMMAGIILLSCLFILVLMRLWATLLNASSSLFNADDEAYELRVAASFALIPSILADLCSIAWDDVYFRSVLTIVCAVWIVALYIIMVAAIKKISYFKAFLSVLMATVVIAGAYLLIYFVSSKMLSSGV